MRTNEELIAALRALCAVESVAGVNVTPQAPYGAGSARALEQTLALCRSLGMSTVNRDGRVGWAEIGQGGEMVGILAHLDVVPAGEGWSHPPFGLTEEAGRLYGRGVTDDKGPAMACIFAMADLLEAKAPLRRRIRLIFGQSEESGEWTDMQWYKAHEELPVFGFTPDADFPAIYGEKGILCFALSASLADSALDWAEGGDASNMVPAWCRVRLKDGRSFATTGRAAHASTPEDGESAITAMMALLEQEVPDDGLVRFYRRFIADTLHGEAMGCALRDEQSGCLTMNAGTLRTREGRIVLELDVRNPVTFQAGDVERPLRAAAESCGLEVRLTENSAPVYMDRDGRVIRALLEVYRAATGDDSPPAVIGGGTYARAMDNIVAFGPMLPGRELTEHQKDEYLLREDLFLLRDIYRAAMEKLAEL